MGDVIDEKEAARVPKQIWEMTKAEYESIYGKPARNSTVTGSFSRHKNAVEVALNRGLSVPEAVLREYDLLESENGSK